MRTWKLVVAVGITLLSVTANAATSYVAPAGNDANPGSLSAPFRTISKASTMARPGDVVEARGGVYYEVVKINAQGTAAARITFRSYPGETAIIDGTGTPAGTDLVQLGSSAYVDFSGFEVRNSTRLGVAGWGAKNIRFTNNRVHRAFKGGVYFGFSTFGATHDLVIDGNEVFNNCLENQYHTMAGGWGQAIGIHYADRVRVTNNKIHSNDGEGVAIIISDNALVERNEVSDNYSVGLYLDNAQYTTVNSNFVYSTGNTRYYRQGYPAAGIGSANESYEAQNPLTNNTITNNIVVNTRWGFYYGAYDLGGGLKNTTVSNNTFYKSAAAMVWIEADAHSNNIIQNNVFFQSGGAVMLSGSTAGSTFRNNNWYGGNAGAAASASDVLGDPRLANAGGFAPPDYKLTAFSPDVQKAAATTAVTSDYFGTLRTGAFDIGAHQFSSSTAPAAGLTAPSDLAATATGTSAIALSWTAATGGVTGYKVYRNGTLVANATGTSWTDQALTASTTYSYQVSATDGITESGRSNSASATTAAPAPAPAPAPAGDTIAPTAPSWVWGQANSGTVIELAWATSTDNVGVTGYLIYRDGVHVATSTGTWIPNTSGLKRNTSYTFHVVAIDAAGNRSAASPSMTYRTHRK